MTDTEIQATLRAMDIASSVCTLESCRVCQQAAKHLCAALAKAWDDGYATANEDYDHDGFGSTTTPNPYREGTE